jgi:hypothetical protein
MGGGLMQLVAYGAQDVYLTGNPQITFFKVVYRRHTNFSLESIEQTFNGTVNFGKKVTCTISRNGDLIHNMYLRVVLPAIKDASADNDRPSGASWVNSVGHALINSVEVEIGGQKIDKHYGEWLHIWNELTQTASRSLGYNHMIGNVPTLTQPALAVAAGSGAYNTIPAATLYVPMQFWFCRNPGLALPLIALQYHEVKVNFDFRPKSELIKNSLVAPYVPADHDQYGFEGDLQASLWVDYIYLDTEERRRFAQVTHEYLIDQLQFPGPETVKSKNENVKLNFNHPCKQLIWTIKDNGRVATRDHFNFTGMNPNVLAVPAPMRAGAAGGHAYAQMMGAIGPRNPVKSAGLQLNGHDRFSKRDGMYFNIVQPYQHHTAVPATGINVYSFAMKPEEHQPSGTCNMSRIDNATLALELEELTDDGGTLSVYATNYNVLRVMSGMGGLAYAS